MQSEGNRVSFCQALLGWKFETWSLKGPSSHSKKVSAKSIKMPGSKASHITCRNWMEGGGAVAGKETPVA